jgi:hypothetical protein
MFFHYTTSRYLKKHTIVYVESGLAMTRKKDHNITEITNEGLGISRFFSGLE